MKSDLRGSGGNSGSSLEKADGELLAINLGITYMEVSSRNQDSVNQVFEQLIQMIERVNAPTKRDSIKLTEQTQQKKSFSIKALCSSC